MLLKRVAVENVRSFLERTELHLDGPISILIGPNGGGKTNLLDAAVMMLRRYILASMYAHHVPTPAEPQRHEFRHNDVLNNMVLERHSSNPTAPQRVEVDIEVTAQDITNMTAIKRDAATLSELAKSKYVNHSLSSANNWTLNEVVPGQRFTYALVDGSLQRSTKPGGQEFLSYLQLYEIDGSLREEYGLAPLAWPMIYFPVNRSAGGFNTTVELTSFNEYEQKRQNDAVHSKSGNSISSLAVGRIADKFHALLVKDEGGAQAEFRKENNLRELTRILQELGYDWELVTLDHRKNRYDIQLTKQGSKFLVGAASSGEKELLTYLFSIFALNVRDALILVDEPELHLHPNWQKTLLWLFEQLTATTGNQFLLATHSPTFVSPASIQYVSRVYSQNQMSKIARLDTSSLPNAKHLLAIVNSQNNEKLFFADQVVLVEGISDRIFFEAVFDRLGRGKSNKRITEVISVGGKGLFHSYASLLQACKVDFRIVADLDYLDTVGNTDTKALFKADAAKIKDDVVLNEKSLDGNALVELIDQGIASGTWDMARELWAYIKNRRVRLKDDLDAAEKSTLEADIQEKRSAGVFILRKGSLEKYLPIGHASKDIDKLITFLSGQDFWDKLEKTSRDEVEAIALAILEPDTDFASPEPNVSEPHTTSPDPEAHPSGHPALSLS